MPKRISALLILAFFMTVSSRSQQAGPAPQGAQSHVVPLKAFPGEQRFEAVSGDVKKAGAVYVIRIHSEAGYIVMPHFHPEDEHIVVVKGSWALGMGERFSPDALETMNVGTWVGSQEDGALRAVENRRDRSGSRNWAVHDHLGYADIRVKRPRPSIVDVRV